MDSIWRTCAQLCARLPRWRCTRSSAFLPADFPLTEEVIESTSDDWGTSGEWLFDSAEHHNADSQIMTIMHRGFSYAVDDLSKLGTGTDPMAAIRSYLAKAILKLRTTTLLNQVEGLFGSALDENIVSGALAAGTPTDANFLTAAMVLEAKARLGERGEELTAIAMHSGIYYSLVNTGLMTFSSNSLAAGSNFEWGGGGVGVTNDDVAYFCGLRVIVDDMLAPAAALSGAAAVYPVYLFGGGVVMEGNQQELRTESDRNILQAGCDEPGLPLRHARGWYFLAGHHQG